MTYVMGVLIFLKICFEICILNLHIFNSDFVSKDERAYYEAICGRKDPDHGANTLNFLSGVLYRCYNKLDAHGYTEKDLVKLRERLTLP